MFVLFQILASIICALKYVHLAAKFLCVVVRHLLSSQTKKMGLSNTLVLYRNLLKYARTLPIAKRESGLLQIKEGFRAGQDASDPSKIQEMLTKANSTLGYLKIITPRSPKDHQQAGRTRTFFGDDVKRSRAVSNWTGSNMDPDSVRRHENSLKRAGFKNNADMKGFF